MSNLRQCQKCLAHKPLNPTNFKPQGRGHLHVCNDCRIRPVRPLPDTPDDTNALLSEIIRLLKSPICSRCGCHGAKFGNPSYCEGCKP